MFGYVPDWPLLAAIVAAVAAGVAVWYARRGAIASEESWRLQRRQEAVSPTSLPLGPEALQILSLVAVFGLSTVDNEVYFGDARIDRSVAAWVPITVDLLRAFDLLERRERPTYLSGSGLAALRAHTGEVLPYREIAFADKKSVWLGDGKTTFTVDPDALDIARAGAADAAKILPTLTPRA